MCRKIGINKLRMESSGLIKGCSCAQTEHKVHNRIQHDKNVLFIIYFLVLDLTKTIADLPPGK